MNFSSSRTALETTVRHIHALRPPACFLLAIGVFFVLDDFSHAESTSLKPRRVAFSDAVAGGQTSLAQKSTDGVLSMKGDGRRQPRALFRALGRQPLPAISAP
jgi:hypothetical protein